MSRIQNMSIKESHKNDFFSGSNTCGTILLDIVSRCHCILSELDKLSKFIPDIFRLESKELRKQYSKIIFSFEYFEKHEEIEKEISSNKELSKIDDEFSIIYREYLARFVNALQAIIYLVGLFNEFLTDLDNNVYNEYTFNVIMSYKEGKQLISEIFYLFGFMLLFIDIKFPDIIRERMFVSYHRYCGLGETIEQDSDKLYHIFRRTGAIYKNNILIKRPQNYPEDYFLRIDISTVHIGRVVQTLNSDDIYSYLSIYPLVEHRSTALNSQASMVLIMLFFLPKLLKTKRSMMTEIVKSYFCDSLVVPLYMGLRVNLVNLWEPYEAAMKALQSVWDSNEITLTVEKCVKGLENAFILFNRIDAICDLDYILRNNKTIFYEIQNANVSLRWLLLHYYDTDTSQLSTSYRELITSNIEFSGKKLFVSLFKIAKIETLFKKTISRLIELKDEKIKENKQSLCDIFGDLCDIFQGSTILKIEKNESLSNWFNNIKNQVSILDMNKINACTKVLNGLRTAINKIKETPMIKFNVHATQIVLKSEDILCEILLYLNLHDYIIAEIQVICDFNYGWDLINILIPLIEDSICNEPDIVEDLHFFYLKLSSAIEVPLMRIAQSESSDFVAVSKYYFSVFVSFSTMIFQAFSKTIFKLVVEISHIINPKIINFPYFIEKSHYKEYGFFDENIKISQLIYQISLFFYGIFKMQPTLHGIVKINPIDIVYDGIRNELLLTLTKEIVETFRFKNKKNIKVQLMDILLKFQLNITSLRKSFFRIKDCLKLNVYKMWDEVLAQIHYHYTSIDYYGQSKSQNSNNWAILLDKEENTYFESILNQFKIITDINSHYFIFNQFSWYDINSHKLSADGLKIFQLLHNTLGSHALHCFKTVTKSSISDKIKKLCLLLNKHDSPENEQLINVLLDCNNKKLFMKTLDELQHGFIKQIKIYTELIAEIGRLVSIIHIINLELKINYKRSSKNTQEILEYFCESLLSDISSVSFPRISQSEELVSELDLINKISHITDLMGIQFINTRYMTTKISHQIPYYLFIIIDIMASLFRYSKTQNYFFTNTPGNHLDFYSFLTGLTYILHDFNYDISNPLSFLILKSLMINSLDYFEKNNNNSHKNFTLLNYLIYLSNISKHFSTNSSNIPHLTYFLPPTLISLITENYD